MEKGAQQSIIIIKKKGHGHGHHGGAWKVALADFMTAMMAFFLLLWLLGSTSKEEQKAISGYFTDPGSEYAIGEGGANPGLINMEQPQKESHSEDPIVINQNDKENTQENTQASTTMTEDALKKELERLEREKLEELQKKMQDQIDHDQVFQEIKDQILIDFTALGLRIQIVDKDKRPMFDSGSAHLKNYSDAVLKALGPLLNNVPNKISVTGHTDSTPYGMGAAYTNWELSADRANSARRALTAGGYPEEKMATVQGMGSAAPFLKDDTSAPINRRIAIIVLKKAVADALTNGGNSGIDSSNIIPSPNSRVEPAASKSAPVVEKEPPVHIMTQQEVDEATDRK